VVAGRVAALDLEGNRRGTRRARRCSSAAAILPPGGIAKRCRLYASEDRFRSRIVMARHVFGAAEYKYFAYPLSRNGRGSAHGAYGDCRYRERWNEAMVSD